ncbi:MAG TPA: F0F1 ATP synthase subunit A [Gemmataceae bacterium]|nr:F0F1 ATP synthase subunit A [Gemmataceae bacterium]
MTRRLVILIGGSLVFWVIVAALSRMAWGNPAVIYSAAASVLCLVPAAITLAGATWAASQPADKQAVAILSGTGVRLAVALGGGFALTEWVPYFRQEGPPSLWAFIGVFYLVTLALETGLTVIRQPMLWSVAFAGLVLGFFIAGALWANQAGPPTAVAHLPKAEEHVSDADYLHITDILFGGSPQHPGFAIPLPRLSLFGYQFQFTKFMLLELIAAVLAIVIFIPLCRRASQGELPKGPFWNAFESLLTFIRDDVARPNIGEHDADHYVPFLWTMFIYILFLNLLGMIPFLGSPTASYVVTGGLAVCAFIMIHGAPIATHGFVPYLKSTWPHIELGHNIFAQLMGFVLSLMIWAIEMFGTVIKSFVLAVRLFANMFAGHVVLASILLFIIIVGHHGLDLLWGVVTVASVAGVVALSLLELFVAFLQAYVFVFLTSLFMGMALHPEH